jgi:hypothetical protein
VTVINYMLAPGVVGGRILWDRQSRTWSAEIIGMPNGSQAAPQIEPDREFQTPLGAQEWVESAWRIFTHQAIREN